MVQSAALTVDAFLATVPPERIDAVRRVRDACRARLAGWEERMQWGMPGYGPPGSDALISFNNQKGYIALYLGKATIDAHKSAMKGAAFGKGCIRFPDPGRIDFDRLDAMISDAYRAKSSATRSDEAE